MFLFPRCFERVEVGGMICFSFAFNVKLGRRGDQGGGGKERRCGYDEDGNENETGGDAIEKYTLFAFFKL